MVYKAADIKHLDLMDSLAKSDPREADEVILQDDVRASLEENILKLCVGLRAKGLGKQAESLESKFIIYKSAANVHLYRVHDEDGEDLVHAAHPDGDVNMGDGEYGDVETTVSKHKKIVDIINKQPNGKLASIVEQCKIVLGVKKKLAQKANYNDKITECVNEGFNYANNIVKEIETISAEKYRTEGTAIVSESVLNEIKEDLEDARQIKDAGNLDYNKIMEITKAVDGIPGIFMSTGNSFSSGMNSYFIADEEGQKLFDKIKQQIAIAKSRFNAAFQLLQGHLEGAQFQLQIGEPSKISLDGKPHEQNTDPTTKAQEWMNTLGKWKMSIDSDKDNSPEDKQKADTWINDKAAAISDLLENVKQSKIAPDLADKQLAEIVKDFNQFKTTWVG